MTRRTGFFLTFCLAAPAWAQVTQRVSVSSTGTEGNGHSESGRISANGRYVAFESAATNLAPGATAAWYKVLLRDRQSGSTE